MIGPNTFALSFAPPKVVKVALGSGSPLTTFGYELAEYSDWNGDGKSERLPVEMISKDCGIDDVRNPFRNY